MFCGKKGFCQWAEVMIRVKTYPNNDFKVLKIKITYKLRNARNKIFDILFLTPTL